MHTRSRCYHINLLLWISVTTICPLVATRKVTTSTFEVEESLFIININRDDTINTEQPDAEGTYVNERPIVAVLSMDIDSEDDLIQYESQNYTSYIAASYVKYMEMAGARAVPVLLNQPDEYYVRVFKGTNGLLIPGGGADIHNSSYQRAGQKLFELAQEAYDVLGDIYPIWGTCDGFELLAYFSNNFHKVLRPCWSEDRALPLNFTEGCEATQIVSQMPQNIYDILENENVTANYHQWCLTLDAFNHKKNLPLRNFWSVVATNHDVNGVEFVSLLESKEYPMWGSQFHPEKNSFEWTKMRKNIPHSKNAVQITDYLANFFVDKCRQSSHRFDSMDEEDQHLIYNYSPIYSGKGGKGYFQQTYLFR